MTFKERMQIEHPEFIDDEEVGGVCGCPYAFGYEKEEDSLCKKLTTFSCEDCWGREIPEAEPGTAQEAEQAAVLLNLRAAQKKQGFQGFQRISKVEGYLMIAKAVALRSTCLRRQYGAVIVKDDCIISTGYNGASRGEPNCCDVGECWREAHNIPHGEQYEKCVAVHAEDNAISQAGRETIGADLYLVGFEDGAEIDARPCMMCSRKIKNARIKRVITKEGVIYENRN